MLTGILVPGSLIPFVVASLAMEITPGPNMAYLAVISITQGRRAGWRCVGGIAVGLFAVGLVCLAGMHELFVALPWLGGLMGWVGFLYFVWLAWDNFSTSQTSEEYSAHAAFRRGTITNILNPKAWIFFGLVLPGFLPEGPMQRSGAMVLLVVYVIIATMVHGSIVVLANHYLARPLQTYMQYVRYAASLLLLSVAGWFLMTNHDAMLGF